MVFYSMCLVWTANSDSDCILPGSGECSFKGLIAQIIEAMPRAGTEFACVLFNMRLVVKLLNSETFSDNLDRLYDNRWVMGAGAAVAAKKPCRCGAFWAAEFSQAD